MEMDTSDVRRGPEKLLLLRRGGGEGGEAGMVKKSSRLIVQNLPKTADETKLRAFFSQRGGVVTDAKVCRMRDEEEEAGAGGGGGGGARNGGASRRFGFVGFRTVDEAVRACEYFDRSFMESSRISVGFAQRANSAGLPRPWSKFSEGSSRFKKLQLLQQQQAGAEEPGRKKARGQEKISSTRISTKREKKLSEGERAAIEDEGFREFLKVVRGARKGEQPVWFNDDIEVLKAASKASARGSDADDTTTTAAAAAADEVGRAERHDGNVKMKKEDRANGHTSSTKKDKNVGDERRTRSAADSDDEKDDDCQDDTRVKDETVSAADYLKSRIVKDFSDEENDEEESDEEESDEEEEAEEEEEEEEEEDSKEDEEIHGDAHMAARHDGHDNEFDEECTRLFVRNLSYTCSEAELKDAFENAEDEEGTGTRGTERTTVSSCHIVVDKESGRSKGIGFVSFSLPEQARRALELMDGAVFQGRLLHVMQAKALRNADTVGGDTATTNGKVKSFKETREEDRKKMSESEQRAWNTLFMRADTVAARVAEKYGVNKSSLLLGDADESGDGDGAAGANIAVKMALGEAQVIAETKASLEREGIDVDLMESSAARGNKGGGGDIARSSCVIIIKNLPSQARQDELESKFEGFGDIARFIMPSTRTMAVVEFVEDRDAKKAFRALAYTRYHHVPLYLEWAPAGLLGPENENGKTNDTKATRAEDARTESAAAAPTATPKGGGIVNDDVDDGEEAEAARAMRIVYVKNLSFGTNEPALEKLCRRLRLSPRAVTIVRRRMDKAKAGGTNSSNGRLQSLGYGFLEFADADVASSAARSLNGEVVDGHQLQCSISTAAGTKASSQQRRDSAKEGHAAGSGGDHARLPATPKLLVRNIPFQATKQELKALFKPFGILKSVRLPRKFDGSHRGFAFVEFTTRQEAAQASRSLAAAHLYGRHVVIESAKDVDGDVDELRRRTRAKFEAGESGAIRAAKSLKISHDNDA